MPQTALLSEPRAIKGENFARIGTLTFLSAEEIRSLLKTRGYLPASHEQIRPHHHNGCNLFAVGSTRPHPDRVEEEVLVGFNRNSKQIYVLSDHTFPPGTDILICVRAIKKK